MSHFFLAGKHHWRSWHDICFPTSEGGLGIISLYSLQKAYDYKIWWSYHQNSTLWVTYMQHKYGRRMHYRVLLYDSLVLKRICRVNAFCQERVQIRPTGAHWKPDSQGQFTLKGAYEECRQSRAFLRSWYIWWPGITNASKIFLWKPYSGTLSLPDNLKCFMISFLTQCPFCRSASSDTNNLFLHCPAIALLWRKYAIILAGPVHSLTSLRSYLMSWWLQSSTSSMRGQLKVVVSHFVCWNIWKEYTCIVFGSEQYNCSRSEERIRLDIYCWSSSVSRKCFACTLPDLVSDGLSPYIRARRHSIVYLHLCPTRRLNLNVDASAGRKGAAGGAILRDSAGPLVVALAFSLPKLSPLRAEIQDLIYAVIYFSFTHTDLNIEIDCMAILHLLTNSNTITGHFQCDLEHLRSFLHLSHSELLYIPRETNTVAHHLAAYPMQHPLLTTFKDLRDLPAVVRGWHSQTSIHHTCVIDMAKQFLSACIILLIHAALVLCPFFYVLGLALHFYLHCCCFEICGTLMLRVLLDEAMS